MKYKKQLVFCLLIMLINSCDGYSFLQNPGTIQKQRPEGWTKKSHGDNVTPAYNIVFPQDKVNRLDLKIEAADWKLMMDNMKELYGDPANKTQGGSPGAQPNQGRNRFPFPGMNIEEIKKTNPDLAKELETIQNLPPDQMMLKIEELRKKYPDFFKALPSSGGGMVSPNGMQPPNNGEPGGGGGGMDMEENPIYRPCTLNFEGKIWYHVGIRFKGNSSLRSSWGRTLKMPF